jgi:O-antigen ligase
MTYSHSGAFHPTAQAARHPARAESPRFEFPGRYVLPLLALIVAFSSSRAFGLPTDDTNWLPQLTADRLLLMLVAVLAAIAVVVGRRGMGLARPTWFEIAFWGIGGLAAASWILFGGAATDYSGAGVTILLNLFVFPAIAFSLLLRTRFSTRDLALCCILLGCFAVYLSVTAVAETLGWSWALIPPEIGDPRIEQHWGRARGPFLQAEFNGAVMVQLLPIVLLLPLLAGRFIGIAGVGIAGLLSMGAYLTQTRAVLLSLLLVLLVGAVLPHPGRATYRVLVIGGLLAAGGLYAAGAPVVPRLGEMGPIYDRFSLLAVTFGMIMAEPVLGIGFGRFDLLQTAYADLGLLGPLAGEELWEGGTHNTLLTLVAELGVPIGAFAVFLFLWPIWVAARVMLGRTRRRLGPQEQCLVVSGLLVLIAFVINASFVELRYTATPNLLFWMFAAVILRVRGLR